MSTVAMSAANRFLDRVPLSRWVHRRVLSRLVDTELEVELSELPPQLDGFRLAFISDVHAGSYLHQPELDQIVERVAAWRPDLVALGGDLLNSRLEELQYFESAFASLSAPHGVVAVPGNHDIFYVQDRERWAQDVERAGIRVLVNEGLRVEREGQSFWLAGIDDLEEGRPHLEAALEGRNPGEPVILLSHHPDFFPVATRAGVALQLSGHTHGGQIRLFGRAIVSHSHEGYVAGWFQDQESRLYVSRGVGATFLPLRWKCDPELVFVTLRTSGRSCRTV
ncbi:MAG: metallophosphoesterase [Planctomycetota bacterium]